MFFRDVPGQNGLKKQLNEMAGNQKIPHAILFTEKHSSGALILAIAFARRLLCTSPLDDDACGQCASCKQIEQLAHPDLIFSFPIVKQDKETDSDAFMDQWRSALKANPFMDHNDWMLAMESKTKQSIIAVQEASRLLRICSMKRFNSPFRPVIIWLPERMNAATANKLLKLIEEPEEGTLFLLVSRAPEELLPTVVSRCQRMNLEHVAEEVLIPFVQHNSGAGEEVSKMSIRFAEGDISLALRMAKSDQNLSQYAEWFVSFTRICYAARLSELLDWCAEVSKKNRDELVSFLRFVASLFEEGIRVKHAMLEFTHPAFAQVDFKMPVFSSLLQEEAFIKMRNELDEAIHSARRNVSPKLLLFHLGIEMMRAFKMR